MGAVNPRAPSAPSDSKRERILMSALQVFGRRGFHQATIEEVARQAGVGKGTIYLYVRSKDALLQEAIQYLAGNHFRQATLVASGEGDVLERIRRILELEGRFFLSQRDVAHAFLHDQTGIGYSVNMRATLTRMHQQRKQVFAGLIRQAQEAGLLVRSLPAERLAMAVMGINNNLLVDALVEGKAADAADLAAFCLNLLLRGAGVRQPRPSKPE